MIRARTAWLTFMFMAFLSCSLWLLASPSRSIPPFLALVLCGVVSGVGEYWQHKEQKRKDLHAHQVKFREYQRLYK